MMPPQENCDISVATTTTTSSPFHHLVPDCRKLVFSYHLHQIQLPSAAAGNNDGKHHHQLDASSCRHHHLIPSGSCTTKTLPPSESASDLQFALNYFKCRGIFTDDVVEWYPLENLYSLELSDCRIPPHQEPSNMIPTFRNLVELKINRGGTFHNEMFQHMESLEVLSIEGITENLTNELFSYLKHLRHLSLQYCHKFTDEAIGNLYTAGSRLEKLNICGCSQITDRAMSFIEGDALKDLSINSCTRFYGEGLQYLRGLQRLSLNGVKYLDCHEAFQCMEGSVQYLSLSYCSAQSLDEEATSYLKGISTLELYASHLEDLTDEAFGNLAGSIKRLQLKECKQVDGLSKNMLWHLSGIKEVEICDTGIYIEEEDLPRLKEVFKNVEWCQVSEDIADTDTLEELQQYIEGNGGDFYSRPEILPY